MKIEPDGRAADAEPADQDARDEVLCARRGERPVEGEHQRTGQAGGREQAQLGSRIGQAEYRIGRAQHVARMRLERHGDRRGAERARARGRGVDHGAMAAMHAVEIADRRDGAVQRGRRRIVMHDDEGWGRLGRHWRRDRAAVGAAKSSRRATSRSPPGRRARRAAWRRGRRAGRACSARISTAPTRRRWSAGHAHSPRCRAPAGSASARAA